jgi:hypothetical protein
MDWSYTRVRLCRFSRWWAGPNGCAPSAACRRRRTVRYSPCATSDRGRVMPTSVAGRPADDSEQVRLIPVRLTPDGGLPGRVPGAPASDEVLGELYQQVAGRVLAPVHRQVEASHSTGRYRELVAHPWWSEQRVGWRTPWRSHRPAPRQSQRWPTGLSWCYADRATTSPPKTRPLTWTRPLTCLKS